MNELDLRFAICNLTRVVDGSSLKKNTFSLTHRFSGVYKLSRNPSGFSGFRCLMKTAKAVQGPHSRRLTPQKWGVNESANLRFQSSAEACQTSARPEHFLKSQI